MQRVPCQRNDSHLTVQVPILVDIGVQRIGDKTYISKGLPGKVSGIALSGFPWHFLTGAVTVIAVAALGYKFYEPSAFEKGLLSGLSDVLPWVVLGGAVLTGVLWKFLHPKQRKDARKRTDGVYCFACDHIFIPGDESDS